MKIKAMIFTGIILITSSYVYAQDISHIHFGVISDIQYCNCDSDGARVYREAKNKAQSAIDTLEQENVEFLLNLGDIIDKYWVSFDTILPVIESASFDVHSLLGNHDFYELTQEQKDSLTILLNMPSRYYTFKKGNWRFIMLDANEISTYAYAEGSPEYNTFVTYLQNIDEVNGHVWNGGILSNQLYWLKNLLAKADTLGEFVIVCGHPNIYPLNMNTMLNYKEVASILEAHNSVKMYLGGHWHYGAYVLNNNIHYLTVKAVLDYADSTAYSIVDITDNEIIIDGYGRELDRNLPYNSDYQLTVENGTGSGTYRQGTTVEVSALSPVNEQFSLWTGDVGVLSSTNDSLVSFPMPAFDINLTANFNVVGVGQNPFRGLNVYPNPAKERLNIENLSKIDEILVFDVSGKQKSVFYPGSTFFSIDICGFNSGLYFLKIIDEWGNNCNKKFVK